MRWASSTPFSTSGAAFYRQPKEVQAAILARIRDNPKVREQVADMLKQRENSRDHGLSR